MEVNMRKEQVVLGVVLLLGAWLGIGAWNDVYHPTRKPNQAKDYEATIPYTPFLADPKDDPGLGDDIFLEPSETRPLPPADLPFPALDRLLPLAVPLPIGQQAGAYTALRLKLAPEKVVKAGEPAAGEPAAGGPAAGGPAAGGPAALPRRIQTPSRIP